VIDAKSLWKTKKYDRNTQKTTHAVFRRKSQNKERTQKENHTSRKNEAADKTLKSQQEKKMENRLLFNQEQGKTRGRSPLQRGSKGTEELSQKGGCNPRGKKKLRCAKNKE